MIWYFVILGVLVTVFVYVQYRLPKPEKYDYVNAVLNTEETEFLKVLNAYRKTVDLQQLKADSTASFLAQLHVDYMMKNQKGSHDSAQDRREELYYLGARFIEEVSAVEFTTIRGAFLKFLQSVGHKRILLSKNPNTCGLSIQRDNGGKFYFTVILFKI